MSSRKQIGSEAVTPPRQAVAPRSTHTPSSSNHDFFLQYAIQTERSLGELKTSVEVLVKVTEKQGERLEKLTETIHKAQGFWKAMTIVGGLLGVILGSALNWLKDYLPHHK